MPRLLAAVPLATVPLLALLLVAFTPAVSAQAAEGASWSVAPVATDAGESRPYFDYTLEPGDVVSDGFSVRNDGATALTLAIYAADAYTTRDGNIDLLAAGEPSVDAGTWVTLDTTEVILQAGESSVIPFTITVPADATPGDHPAGIVASLTSDDPSAQVQVDRRLGSRLYTRIGGDLAPAVETSDLHVEYSGTWNPLAIGTLDVVYSLTNTGNTRVTAQSQVEVAGPFGVAAATTAAIQLPEVLPGSDVEVRQQLTGIGALLWLSGAVSIAPSSVGIGAAQLDAVSLDFSLAAVPATLLLMVLVVAIIVVGVVILVRVRMRRRRTAAVTTVTEG